MRGADVRTWIDIAKKDNQEINSKLKPDRVRRIMKIKHIILTMIILILSAVTLAGAQERGLWVWSAADKIVDDFANPEDESNLTWEQFISFIEAPHGDTSKKVTELYMALYDSMLFQPKKTQKFIADMRGRGYKIYVVLAEPLFAMPDKAENFANCIKNIIQFQKKGAPNERFEGIMLDIEPHLLKGQTEYVLNWNNPDHFPVIWDTYMNNLKFALNAINTYNTAYEPDMKFSDAVAFWYDDPVDRDGDSVPEDLAEEIISEFDNYDFAFYTIQSYRNYAQGEGGIIDVSQNEMAKCKTHGIQCLLTVETMPIHDAGLTPEIREIIGFENEGNAIMETQIGLVKTHYESSNDGTAYRGMGIHSYGDHLTGEIGYQDLTADSSNKAPAVIINYPDGVKYEGIAFTDNIDIDVSVFIDSSVTQNYNLKLRWKKESEPDNDYSTIIEFTNVPHATKSVTHQFDVSELSTTPSDRMIIRADISYAGVGPADQISTFDVTNFGVAVNEIPAVPTDWSATSDMSITGTPLGLKAIPDNEGVIRAVYYSLDNSAVTKPGIWYCESLGFGSTWRTMTNLTVDRNSIVNNQVVSTWPRKHVFYKNGNFMVIAWVETANQKLWGEETTLSTDKIFTIMSNDNGQNWQGTGGSSLPAQANIIPTPGPPHNYVAYPDFPEAFIDSSGNVYLVWKEKRKEYDSNAGDDVWKTVIKYRKYTYSTFTGYWTDSSVEDVRNIMYSNHDILMLNNPAVCKTANGKIHVVWSEYKNTYPFYGAIKSKTKNTESTLWSSITEKLVSQISYTENQRKSDNDYCRYPVYFPKLSYDNNMLYAVWQYTTMTPKNREPGSTDLLPLQSEVWFAKLNTSSPNPSWETNQVGNGYAPYMSIWKNGSQTVFQLVYSNNFAVYRSEDIISTGDLIYRESVNEGSSWSNPEYLATGSGTANGVQVPYTNNIYSWDQAVQYRSYPFIVTESHGISLTNWYQGGPNTDDPIKKFKTRNILRLNSMETPFADFNDNDGIKVKWNVPDTPYAPSGYYLFRMANNDSSTITALNNGNPILALNFIDRTALEDDTYYRYKIAYKVTGITSPASSASNTIKKGLYLPVEYFDYDSQGNPYTGVEINPGGDIGYIKYADNESDTGGNQIYKIRYENLNKDDKFALMNFQFPATMDFLRYGCIDLRFKIEGLEQVDGKTPRIKLSMVEKTTGEYYDVGSIIMPQQFNDGQWHQWRFFLDIIGGETKAKLDKDDIEKIVFVFEGKGKVTLYVDDIQANNIPFILLENNAIDATGDPVHNTGGISGKVLNRISAGSGEYIPVTLTFGNMPAPWTLRVFTQPQIKNNAGTTFDVKRDGLIRYERDNDYYFTDYAMPIKMWCKTYAPPGFFDNDGEIINEDYRALGFPPIENRYFFRGYDFNGDKKLGILLPSDGSFIEGLDPGEYPFDIDGDGFRPGDKDDDFFNDNDGRVLISEEPAWMFVPLLKPASGNVHPSAVVMDPSDRKTWRILADNNIGAGDHNLKLYFAAFVGIDQVQYDYDKYKAYGEYTGKIIVELINN